VGSDPAIPLLLVGRHQDDSTQSSPVVTPEAAGAELPVETLHAAVVSCDILAGMQPAFAYRTGSVGRTSLTTAMCTARSARTSHLSASQKGSPGSGSGLPAL